jgi:hypothetical protein
MYKKVFVHWLVGFAIGETYERNKILGDQKTNVLDTTKNRKSKRGYASGR